MGAYFLSNEDDVQKVDDSYDDGVFILTEESPEDRCELLKHLGFLV